MFVLEYKQLHIVREEQTKKSNLPKLPLETGRHLREQGTS